ncbi:hypothetical protein OG949_04290 [Streptomyces scopuliridis]|uniref:hypothetical protein n=1 Tax=Streptomyces scopuliridis TaxID=452529 RepID=UPI002DDC1B72|nr:hypothetical protein [Streptomyces scopuliridis]WSB32157.1 hypothetical protein OG949_04290 [Streptomyces scopuliridis]
MLTVPTVRVSSDLADSTLNTKRPCRDKTLESGLRDNGGVAEERHRGVSRLGRHREGIALLVVLVLAVLAEVAVSVGPASDRPLVGVAVSGLLAVVLVIGIGWLCGHWYVARHRSRPERGGGDADVRFTDEALAGFPFAEVSERLGQCDTARMNRVYSAWVLASHGHDAEWIVRCLDVPLDVAEVLVGAANRRLRTSSGAPEADRLEEQEQDAEDQVAAQHRHPQPRAR